MKHQEQAQFMQRKSLSTLNQLVDRSIQVLTFMDVLYKYKLLQYVGASGQETLAGICRKSFKDLVTDYDATEHMKSIMKLIIGKDTAGNNVDQAIELLSNRCTAYFGENALREMRAYYNLTRAESSNPEEADHQNYLDRAFNIYKEIGDKIAYSQLVAVAAKLSSLNQTVKAVELLLNAAKMADPENYAVDYSRNMDKRDVSLSTLLLTQKQPLLNQRRYNQRIEYYKAALNILELLPMGIERKQVLNLMVDSDDVLFHEQLYGWYIDHNMLDELMRTDPDYLEDVRYIYLLTNN
jgi:nuclear pore complex protein Nup155